MERPASKTPTLDALVEALSGRRLAAKFVVPFVVIMFVLALGASWVVLNLVTGSITQRYTNQLLDAGRNVNDNIIRVESQHLELLRLMANTQGVDTALKSGDANQLQKLLTPLQANSEFDFVDVVNASGQQVLAIRPSEAKLAQPVDPSIGTWQVTQKSLRGEKDSFGDKWTELIKTAYGGMMYTAGPVTDEGDHVVGAILVGISFDDLLKQLTKNALTNVSIYTTDGKLFGTSLDAANGGAQLDLDSTVLTRVFGGNSQTVQRMVQVRGHEFLELVGGLVVRDKVVGAVGVAIPTAAIDRSSEQTRAELTVSFTVVTLIILAFGLIQAGRITAPIREIVRVCRAAQQGDFEERAKVDAKDETAVIADTLNMLLDRMSGRTD